MAESRPFVDFKAIKARVAIVDRPRPVSGESCPVMTAPASRSAFRNSHSKQFRLSIVVACASSCAGNLSFRRRLQHRPRQALEELPAEERHSRF